MPHGFSKRVNWDLTFGEAARLTCCAADAPAFWLKASIRVITAELCFAVRDARL